MTFVATSFILFQHCHVSIGPTNQSRVDRAESGQYSETNVTAYCLPNTQDLFRSNPLTHEYDNPRPLSQMGHLQLPGECSIPFGRRMTHVSSLSTGTAMDVVESQIVKKQS